MATTLINTRKAIMPQIHASWNEFRRTEEGMIFMFGEVGSNYRNHHDIPFAEDFTEKDAPWSSKQSVLERNAAHANKLIRLYIALNIDVSDRMPIWQFFEINTDVVDIIKDHISTLKRVKNVLKKQQQYNLEVSNANDLYLSNDYLSLYKAEKELKMLKDIKELKARNAALKRAKKREAKKKAQYSQIKDEYKIKVLNLLKIAEKNNMTLQDVIVKIENQL